MSKIFMILQSQINSMQALVLFISVIILTIASIYIQIKSENKWHIFSRQENPLLAFVLFHVLYWSIAFDLWIHLFKILVNL
jgi:hypothetical protein